MLLNDTPNFKSNPHNDKCDRCYTSRVFVHIYYRHKELRNYLYET